MGSGDAPYHATMSAPSPVKSTARSISASVNMNVPRTHGMMSVGSGGILASEENYVSS